MSSSWNCSAQYCCGVSVKEPLRPSQLRPVTPRSTPLTRRPGGTSLRVVEIVSAVGFCRYSAGESIFPLKGKSGDPDGPTPDAARTNVSDDIVIAVVVRTGRCELTFPSRRLRSMDNSPSPIVTRMEYQCLPTIALGMEANTLVFERSSSPPDAVTSAISPKDQTA